MSPLIREIKRFFTSIFFLKIASGRGDGTKLQYFSFFLIITLTGDDTEKGVREVEIE
jgi:hypothetical protein